MSPVRLADPVEAFWSRVPTPADGCWNWPGSVGRNGYGQVHRFDKTMTAHRYAYLTRVGPIPPGMDVCHRCDNRRCVRPDHLFTGTRRDNMADMLAKGRPHGSVTHPEAVRRGPAHPRFGNPHKTSRGTDNSRALLTPSDVLEIRRLAAQGWEARFIAGAFGVSDSAIQAVKSRQTWAWLA